MDILELMKVSNLVVQGIHGTYLDEAHRPIALLPETQLTVTRPLGKQVPEAVFEVVEWQTASGRGR